MNVRQGSKYTDLGRKKPGRKSPRSFKLGQQPGWAATWSRRRQYVEFTASLGLPQFHLVLQPGSAHWAQITNELQSARVKPVYAIQSPRFTLSSCLRSIHSSRVLAPSWRELQVPWREVQVPAHRCACWYLHTGVPADNVFGACTLWLGHAVMMPASMSLWCQGA